MKISPLTINLLKSLSSINQSMLFKPGNVVSTISIQKSVLASATISESFPCKFAIWDLNELLSALRLFKDPELEFGDTHVTISDLEKRLRLPLGSEEKIVTPPSDLSKASKIIENAEIRFLLNQDDLAAMQKAAAVLCSPHFSVVSKGESIEMIASDVRDNAASQFSMTVASKGTGAPFNIILSVDNLKVLKGSYEVSISSQGISHFKNTEMDLEYFISIDQSSRYGDTSEEDMRKELGQKARNELEHRAWDEYQRKLREIRQEPLDGAALKEERQTV